MLHRAGNGVLALMDMLLKELKDENTEATHEEETAQRDYEKSPDLAHEGETARVVNA